MRCLVTLVVTLVLCVPAVAQTCVPAQKAAENMARRGSLFHAGNSCGRVEGIGFSTVSADAAIRSCCFWGSRKAREIGVARGVRGWFAVVRYY